MKLVAVIAHPLVQPSLIRQRDRATKLEAGPRTPGELAVPLVGDATRVTAGLAGREPAR